MLAEHHDRSATVAFAREIMRFASEDVMSDVRRMRHEYSDLMRGRHPARDGRRARSRRPTRRS